MAADILRPFVFWGQKVDCIFLKVDLRQTEVPGYPEYYNIVYDDDQAVYVYKLLGDYKAGDLKVERVDLTEDGLEVLVNGVGAQGNNKYGFDLDFYLPVDPEESKYRQTERGIEFNIKKKGAEVWPRLTEKHVKLAWLKIDFDRFAVEDEEEEEEEENDDERQAKLMAEQLARELKEEGLDNSPPDLTKAYLFFYNLFQFVGYTYIVCTLSYHYFKFGPGTKEKAFQIVGTQLMVCQIVALLEVLHPLIGLVKTGVTTTLMQVLGRNFVLFALILQDIRLQDAPVVWYLFMTWSAIELVRYPFYMLSTIEYEIAWITWLRYTAWIPLYPLGILFEATIVIMSIPLFEESNIFSIQLPNTANFAFYFPWFLRTYLLIIAMGAVKLLSYMYAVRKKKLSRTTSFLKKMM